MLTNKLIESLKYLSRKEMTRFAAFTASPYFNKHDKVRELIDYLSSIYPRFDEKRCDRYLIYDQLYPGQPFDKGKLFPVFTYAYRLFEQFLIQEQFEVDEESRSIFFLHKLRNKQHYRQFEKHLNRQELQCSQQPVRDSAYLFQRYRLAREASTYFDQLDKRKEDDSLEKKLSYLDLFYMAEKLKGACELQVRKNIFNTGYSSRFLDIMLSEIDQHKGLYQQQPAIDVYYRLYRMLSIQDAAYYYEALGAFGLHLSSFGEEEQLTIYNYFMNYCISRINSGDERFLQEVFKLYRAQLEQELLLEDGTLSEWDYKNIVTTAIRLEELDWVKTFIETYKEKLAPEVVDNAYRFNLASYYYAAGQLEEVQHLLIQVEYSDLRYNLGAKALLLRTYYDLEEYEALFSLADSFRQYLQRNKLISDSRRKGYYNLFRLTRKLAYLKSRADYMKPDKTKRELERLREEINGTADIFNRSWLVEKMM